MNLTLDQLYSCIALHAMITRNGVRGVWLPPEELAQRATDTAKLMTGYKSIDPAEYGKLLGEYDALRAENKKFAEDSARLLTQTTALNKIIATLEADLAKVKKK